MPAPGPPRRRLHRGTEEEDASQLKLGNTALVIELSLGPEFNDADTLTTSEAKLLIDVVLTQRAKETNEELPLTEYISLALPFK